MAANDIQSPDFQFHTTHWSVVQRAARDGSGDGVEALNHLCRICWYPIYAFVRREGKSVDEAKDLTQAFFEHLLSSELLSKADPARGRFRTFLIRSLRNFLNDGWRKSQRQKRGGEYEWVSLDLTDAEGRYLHEPASVESPDELFERRWALDLVERVRGRLRAEFEKAGELRRYEILKESADGEGPPYAELAAALGVSEGAVKTAVRRLRLRFRYLLKLEVADLLADATELEAEMRFIAQALARGG